MLLWVIFSKKGKYIMKFVEGMTVFDAVEEVNRLEEKLAHIENKMYVAATVPSRLGTGNDKLIDVKTTLRKSRIIVKEHYKHDYMIGPNQYLKENFEDVAYYIDHLYKLRTAISEFNSTECIIFKSSKMTIRDALILMDKIIMERDFYQAALDQYDTVMKNKENLDNIARNGYYPNCKVANPNKISHHYKRDIELLNKRLKKLNDKIDKKWKSHSIQIEVRSRLLISPKHTSRG
jgi:hypothetical protein